MYNDYMVISWGCIVGGINQEGGSKEFRENNIWHASVETDRNINSLQWSLINQHHIYMAGRWFALEKLIGKTVTTERKTWQTISFHFVRQHLKICNCSIFRYLCEKTGPTFSMVTPERSWRAVLSHPFSNEAKNNLKRDI